MSPDFISGLLVGSVLYGTVAALALLFGAEPLRCEHCDEEELEKEYDCGD